MKINFESEQIPQDALISEVSNNAQQELIEEEQAQEKKKKPRLLSLDIFRGLTMTGMILVDDQGTVGGGASIWPVRHSEW